MRSLWVAAIALAACGGVVKTNDASIDAYVPDSGEPVCMAGEMVCNNTCANLQTSEQYCGNCTTQCTSVQGCVNGSCVAANTSCQRVREIDSTAPDGLYSDPQTGRQFYCDFAGATTYDAFAMGIFNGTYAGYVGVSIADLQTPGTQAAFIALMNAQNGLPTLQTWVSGNCCFSAPNGDDFLVGGAHFYPGLAAGSQCSPAAGYNMPPYMLYLSIPLNTIVPLPMPANFFTTYPVTSDQLCSNSTNPGLFVKKHGLN